MLAALRALTYFAAGFVVAIVVVGCSDPNGRQRVSGEILLDGQPLDSGKVSLRPVGTGPLAAGRIKNGKFVLTSDKGPLPGAYLIEIESQRGTGKKVPLIDNPSIKIEETEQIIPSDYNERSQLRIEVEPGGSNHFKFDLNSTGVDS